MNPFIEAGGKVIIVFDGACHPLKGKEHEKRYGDPDAKKARLKELEYIRQKGVWRKIPRSEAKRFGLKVAMSYCILTCMQ